MNPISELFVVLHSCIPRTVLRENYFIFGVTRSERNLMSVIFFATDRHWVYEECHSVFGNSSCGGFVCLETNLREKWLNAWSPTHSKSASFCEQRQKRTRLIILRYRSLSKSEGVPLVSCHLPLFFVNFFVWPKWFSSLKNNFWFSVNFIFGACFGALATVLELLLLFGAPVGF